MKALKYIIPAAIITGAGVFALKEKKASKGNLTEVPDYLLVLGCRVRGTEAEDILKSRIEAAGKYLLENKEVKAVCCGGIVHADQYKSEAEVIKEGLLQMGVEEERIILEDKSTTTEENFINARGIIEELEGKRDVSLAFLTSEFHLMRASYIAKSVGVPCKCTPSKTPLNKRYTAYLRELVVYPVAIIRGNK